jgi:hypothetical protein
MKLSLTKETVHVLQADALHGVVGGATLASTARPAQPQIASSPKPGDLHLGSSALPGVHAGVHAVGGALSAWK